MKLQKKREVKESGANIKYEATYKNLKNKKMLTKPKFSQNQEPYPTASPYIFSTFQRM